MRPFLLVSLLVLSFLLYEAQGIRMEKGCLSTGHHEKKQEDITGIKSSSNGGVGEVIGGCKNGHSSGRNRKLMTKTSTTSISSTITTSKNQKNEGNKAKPISEGKSSSEGGLGGEEENFSDNSSPGKVSEHRKAASERYPDILDIAGMDYSLAKRKPPIHN